MLIVWGEKIKYKREGFAADFCELCGSVQAFQIRSIERQSHIQYVGTGLGEYLGFERKCCKCHCVTNGNQFRYKECSKKPLPLTELQALTFPKLEEVYHQQLALVEKARSSPTSLSRDERLQLISAPLIALSPQVEKHYSATNVDKEILFALIAAMVIIAMGPMLMRKVAPDSPVVELSQIAFFLVAAGVVVWQVVESRTRYVRRKIVPLVVGAIRSLHPKKEEIESVLNWLAQNDHKIGSKMKAEDLMEKLRV